MNVHRCAVVVASCIIAATAAAQTSTTVASNEIVLSAGALSYNFDRRGVAPIFTIGVAHHFGPNLIVAGDASVAASFKARPAAETFDYDASYTTTLISAQWQVPIGRFQPYVGVGAGYYNLNLSTDLIVALLPACFGSDRCMVDNMGSPPTHRHGTIESALLGSRFSLTDAVLLSTEARITNYASCTGGGPTCQAEVRIGIGRRF